MLSELFNALCTLDLKSTEDAEWSKCVHIHVMQRKESFPDTKVWNVQNMHHLVSCTVVLMKHMQSVYSCTTVSPFFTIYHCRKKTKNKLNITFSVHFPHLCAELVRTRFAYPKANSTQSYALCIGNDVSVTPVELIQNMQRFVSCAIGQVMLRSSALCLYSTKAKNMLKSFFFRCHLRLCAQRTSNQDGLLRDSTMSKVTRCPQITKFPWSTSRMCSVLSRAL